MTIRMAVQILASHLQSTEQFLARGRLCRGNARKLRLDLAVIHQNLLRQRQKVFLEAARLKLSRTAVRQRPHLRQDRLSGIQVKARDEIQARRASPRRSE